VPKPPAQPQSRIAKRREAARDEGGAAYKERRAEIIRVAKEVFRTNGYRGTALSQVSDVLAMDRASLYYYVGSKEELFHEVVGDAVEANTVFAESIAAGEGSPAEKLRTVVVGLMQSYAESYPFLYFYIQEDLGHPGAKKTAWSRAMNKFNKRYEAALTAIVQEGVDDGTFATDADAWLITYGILGMLGWSNRWFDPRSSTVDAEEIGNRFADTVLHGLQPPAPKRTRRAAG
jgi:AcrR family transcriptional regulator